MTLAEQVLQLKTDIDEVYKAGKKATGGVVECDIDHEELYNSGYNLGFDTGYAEGQSTSGTYNLLQYASTVQFQSCNVFDRSEVEINLGESTINLTSFIDVKTTADTNKILEHLTINNPGLPNNMNRFMQCTYSARDTVLKKLTLNFDTQMVTSFSGAFASLFALEEIDGIPLDFSSATTVTNLFGYCNELKEIRFRENTLKSSMSLSVSSKLSAVSIQSIIDGLATVTAAQTLTLHSAVSGALTDDQMIAIATKNWSVE